MYNLERFTEAQERYDTYKTALDEIRKGRKRSHWIWFIFPQVKGLGYSYNSRYYGIGTLEEAMAYLENDILRGRLEEMTKAMLDLEETDPERILGGIDAIKFRSSMTLFDLATPGTIYAEALEKFFGGRKCQATLDILAEKSKD